MNSRNLLGLALVSFVANADTPITANQGKPGNQGPWPVTCVSGCTSGIPTDAGTATVNVNFDGGYLGTTAPVPCRATALDGGAVHQIVQMGVNALQVPAAPAAGRVYVNVCSSLQNTSTILVKCRADGVAPVYAAGAAGDVLATGDCVLYTAPPAANTVQCITNVDAGNFIDTYECLPL